MSQQTGLGGAAPFLVIVNFIPPYDAEIAGLLSGPEGATVRFRYQTKYAPTIQRIDSLAGRPGTVLLRDRATGWFMPLRSGIMRTSRLVGDVIYMTVELQQTAAIAADQAARNNQVTQFNALVNAAIGSYSNAGNTDLRNLVLHEQGDIASILRTWREASQDDEVSRWGNVIKLLDEHYPGLDLDFFKILGVKSMAGSELSMQMREESFPAYVLRAGAEFRVEVLQRTYTGRTGDSSVATQRALELTVLNDDIRLRQSTVPILGKYDILSFFLYVSKKAKPGLHQSLLSIVRVDRGQRYGVEIPLLVQRGRVARMVRVAAVLVFALSLAAYISPDTVVSILTSNFLPHLAPAPSPSVVDKAAVVVMLLSANATGLTNWIADHAQIA